MGYNHSFQKKAYDEAKNTGTVVVVHGTGLNRHGSFKMSLMSVFTKPQLKAFLRMSSVNIISNRNTMPSSFSPRWLKMASQPILAL